MNQARKPRILVVEDEVIIAMDIQQLLVELGYEPVGHAVRGDQAILLATERKPDLILMDIQLAGAMDGITAAQIIRAQFEIPIIFVTAFEAYDIIERAKFIKPFGFILKPFDKHDLRTVIEMELYKHKAEKQLRPAAHTPNPTSFEVNNVRRVSCKTCHLNTICLPIAVNPYDVEHMDDIIKHLPFIRSNDHVYKPNDVFKGLYIVRAGSVKTYLMTDQGEFQINGFYLPSDIFGFDGMSGKYINGAIAIDDAHLCELSLSDMEKSKKFFPQLQNYVIKLMGKTLTDNQRMISWMAQKTAEMRLASFLYDMSLRHAKQKLSPSKFHLPMSRADIGSYLGLGAETVSKLLTRLESQGLVTVKAKDIELHNLNNLLVLSGLHDKK